MSPRFFLNISAISLLAMGATSALAQTAGDPHDDLIVISATFAPSRPAAIGGAVSVLDETLLAALPATAASDLLRLTPALSISRAGPLGTQTQVRIRGAEANHTQLFIDGIEANDPAASSEYGFSELMSAGIRRIEVLRGAQSAMYGSEALGGVISIFTRGPFDGGARVYADLTGGSFGTVQANGGSTLAGEKAGLSFASGYHRTDGINISPTGTEKDGSETFSAQIRAELRPNENGRMGMSALYVQQRSDYDDTQFFDPDAPYVVDTPGLLSRSKRVYARAFVELTPGDSGWVHLLESTLVSTRNENRDGNPDNNNDRDGSRFTVGARSSVALHAGALAHGITLGAAFEREGYHDRSRAFGGFSQQRVSRTQGSLIGQYQLGIAERLFADASVRQDFNSGFADATTWRLSASALVGAGFRLHASGGRGITNPTFTDQFGFFPGSFVGNPDLVPEQATGWDAGVEWRHGQLRLDVTWFSARLKHEIVTRFIGFTTTTVNESGVSRRNGVEVMADYATGPLTLTASYTWLKATEQATAGAARTTELRRPKHQASLAATWDATDRLMLSAAISHTGARLDDDFRSFPAVRRTLSTYTLVDAGAQYRLSRWLTAFARAENMLDESYQDVFGYRTSGIGVFAGLRLRRED